MRKLLAAALGSVPIMAALALPAAAGPAAPNMPHDPLHAFCVLPTPACADNHTNTPTNTNPPGFGFWASGGPVTGDYLIEILVPNSEDPTPGAVAFTISGIQGGAHDTDPIPPTTASLFSATAWTGAGHPPQQLDSYLGLNGSEANPIGAFLPAAQALVPAATGFFVYQADLSINEIQAEASKLSEPLLKITSSGGGFSPDLPLATYAVAFLKTDKQSINAIGTASSGALFVRRKAPEPGSLTLLGVGLAGLAIIRRRHAGRRAQ